MFFADFDILPKERSGVFRSACLEMGDVYTNELLLNEVYGMVDYFGWSLIQWRARFGESRDCMPNLYPSQIPRLFFHVTVASSQDPKVKVNLCNSKVYYIPLPTLCQGFQ